MTFLLFLFPCLLLLFYYFMKYKKAENFKRKILTTFSLPDDIGYGEAYFLLRKEITNRKSRDSIYLLSHALNLLNEGLVIMSPEGKILYTNRFARELLGMEKDLYKDMFFYEVISDLDIISFINENFSSSYSVWDSKKIKDKYVQVIFASDVNEKVLLLRDLTQAKRYENMKKDFIANVSHELKTPVATLKLLMETLEEECKDNGNALNFISKANGRIECMDQLIQDLITLTMLETSKGILYKNETVDMNRLIEKIADEVSDTASQKGVIIEVELPKSLNLSGDERLFYFIFRNLIDNSVKYNYEGGKVKVLFSHLPRECCISVCDTGPGIPKSHLPFIFERFYRVDKSRSRKLGGTGLGLSIVKLAVEKLGGKVEVESKVGKGTCFRVYFPYND